MKVSLVTTCANRLRHLQQTLPKNLKDNDAEFILVDYNCQQGTGDWIRKNFASEMKSGKLVYYRVLEVGKYFSAHAKNIGGKLASGDVICNIDADNYAGVGFASWLADVFNRDRRSIVIHLEGYHQSLHGKLALSRESFHFLRGYDEALIYGWGVDDFDLRHRGIRWGLKPVAIPSRFWGHINHDNRFRGTEGNKNQEIKLANDISGKFWVNEVWGKAKLVKNFPVPFC